MQTENQITTHLIKQLKQKSQAMSGFGQGEEQPQLLDVAGVNEKLHSGFGKQDGGTSGGLINTYYTTQKFHFYSSTCEK